MEFKTFLNAFIKIPCQIIRAGRQLIYRVLNYAPHLPPARFSTKPPHEPHLGLMVNRVPTSPK